MTKTFLPILYIILLLNVYSFSQDILPGGRMERETRAVWLTTNFRLDWPPPIFDEEVQKQELVKIFDNIKKKNLNTIYFQVRSNGTVFYKSEIEPFTPYLTGTVGQMPSYDPLEFAIKEAHKRGIEIHAWINVVRCFSGKEENILNHPRHVKNAYPELVVKTKTDGADSYWLDPGLPETESYLTSLVSELVSNYKIDGLHFDFLRYPGNNFDDDFSYSAYGNGKDKNDWRRDNITRLVKELSFAAKSINPIVKVGAAPFGIYKNIKGAKGAESYFEVYQDSWKWIEEKYLDYIVPQIYWDINSNPRFDALAENWRANVNERNLILGVAAYKDEVKNEIEDIINISRKVGAEGVCFFRYQNIADYDFKSFEQYTYPAAMPWIDILRPEAPQNLAYEFINDKQIRLSWNEPNSSVNKNGVGYYTLYRLDNLNTRITSENFFEIIEADKTSVILDFEKPNFIKYYFTLTSVDKLWNESLQYSNIVEITLTKLAKLAKELKHFEKPVLYKDINGTYKILLYSSAEEEIDILAGDKKNQTSIQKVRLLLGENIISVSEDLSKYSLLKIKFVSGKREESLQM